MTSERTIEDLIGIVQSQVIDPSKDADNTNGKYVIYARKSTDEKDKQVRSLPDQIAKCKEYAEANNLRVSKEIVTEKESAKEPDIRPKFREMIENIRRGKYDGILAWHPDRLARNMKDAGEIIDMLDKNMIMSLKFPSFMFENTTSGKMLLGITFVLSKQYSDNLSDNVKRGIVGSIEEGKWINKSKHGYIKDKNQFLRPDLNNFLLIQKTFQMRLKESATLEEIAKFLNDSGYSRTNTEKGKTYVGKMTKQKIATYMRDPIYAGVLAYGNSVVNLAKKYDFQPMITADEYFRINSIKSFSQVPKIVRAHKTGHKIKANLMLGKVKCVSCGETMSSGIGGKKNYYYYRCDNILCVRKGHGTRAQVVVNFVIKYLNKTPFSSEKAYGHYSEEIERVNIIRLREKKEELRRLQAQRRKIKIRKENTKTALIEEKEEEWKVRHKQDFKKLEKEDKELDDKICTLREEITAHKSIPLTYKEFIELWKNMAQTVKKKQRIEDLDKIIKKIFSNFTVSAKKVEEYTLNPPFDGLEDIEVLNGGR